MCHVTIYQILSHCFTFIISFYLYNILMKQALSFSLSYSWRNRHIERLYTLPQITELICGRKNLNLGCLTSSSLTYWIESVAEDSSIIKVCKKESTSSLPKKPVEYDINKRISFLGMMDYVLMSILRIFIRLKLTCSSCGC